MTLCNTCPVCGKDLNSRWHTAEWTVRTLECVGQPPIDRINLRVTCNGGQRLGVWVTGDIQFFYMNKFAEKYLSVVLKPYQEKLIYDILEGRDIEIMVPHRYWSSHKKWWVRHTIEDAISHNLKVAVATPDGVIDGKEWLKK